MERETKYLGAVMLVCLAAAVALTAYFRYGDRQAHKRAVQAANAWLLYAEKTAAAACKAVTEDAIECVVTRSSGVTMTVHCDGSSVFECTPVVERP